MTPWKVRGRGVRREPGQMNGMERKYADHVLLIRQLAGEIAWYAFDAVKLRLAGNTFYTPDFLVMLANGEIEIHEVKGTSKGKPLVEDDAAVKIKVAASLFPLRFRMVWFYQSAWQERIYE